jgi:hypothetical protein
MPSFAYTAYDNHGNLQTGIISALSLQLAREALKKKGLSVEEIHEATMEEQGIKKAWMIDTKEAVSGERLAVSNDKEDHQYIPFIETMRLYAGWLLAWFSLIYILGAYQYSGNEIPFDIPLIRGLLFSKTVFMVTWGTFLFLLLTSLYRIWHIGNKKKGILLTTVWIVGMVFFGVNI